MSKFESAAMRFGARAIPDEKVVTTGSGAIRVEQLAPTVVRHTVNGVGTMAFYRPIVDSCDEVLAKRGKVIVLIDSWDQVRLETDFREALTKYLQDQKDRDCSALMLVQSKLVKMAMSVTNMLAGRSYIEIFADIKEWEQRCGEVVPGMRRRPLERGDGGYA